MEQPPPPPPPPPPPHVVILPSPGMGHLIPLAELAKQLTITHGFSVTLITFSNFSNKAQTSLLSSLPSTISFLSLPPIPLHDLPSNYPLNLLLSTLFSRSLPSLHSILSSLTSTTHVTAYITDIFGSESFSTARSLAVPPFLFFTSTLLLLSLVLHLPDLNTSSPDPLTLPGCIPIRTEDLPDGWSLQDEDNHKRMLRHSELYNEADGILVNSFIDIEPGAARFLLEEAKPGRPRVYPIGPVIQTGSIGDADVANCLTWLDEQPRGSVLFVCFGSGGTLSVGQTTELALGLEMSGQRFLWVVRSPSDGDACGAYFDAGSARDPFAFLPQRFVERNRGVGMVVASWAPQGRVLAHPAVGGFLSHCGWNSTLESVVIGVPVIAWPLYAEQRMNAAMLEESVKVGMRVRVGEDGVVGRAEVARVVRELMEGEEGKELRVRMRSMSEMAVRALGEGGDSRRTLDGLVEQWKKG